MPERKHPRLSRLRTRIAAVVVGLMAVSLAAVASPAQAAEPTATGVVSIAVQTSALAPVKTADLSKFNAGDIISDKLFFEAQTMTASQIQMFLDSKVSKCSGGTDEDGLPIVCLKDKKDGTQDRPADSYCKGYTGQGSESAAMIIAKVAKSCGVNPQVILVMLQKEQALVTHVWPSNWRYTKALGQGCPDDAPCNEEFAGFFNQVYGGARQMKVYAKSGAFTWYPVGQTSQVLYHPAPSNCGSSGVTITNTATAGMYYYTPYQPNRAALDAGYGVGDKCSAYGNRNFYNYFTDWFGSTHSRTFSVKPAPTISGTPAVGKTLTAKVADFTPTQTKFRYRWQRNGVAIPGALDPKYKLVAADQGKSISVRVTAVRSGYIETTTTSKSVTPGKATVDVSRIAGENREETAVAVSKKLFPNGADRVIIATSENFPDAISASAAAARMNASLLLVRKNKLSAVTKKELQRLQPSKATIVGSRDAISSAVVTSINNSVPGLKSTRAQGATRYETSLALAKSLGTSKHVMIATGQNFPDALTAAGVASTKNAPVVLVRGTDGTADAATLRALKDMGVESITLFGGTSVVSLGISTSIQHTGISAVRYKGDTRYGTNASAVEAVYSGPQSSVVVATGLNFPDALAGSLFASKTGQPMMLSKSGCLSQTVDTYISRHGVTNVTLIGGTTVLSADVAALKRC